MKTITPFSPERLFRLRRLRRARRLFKQSPLFAFDELSREYQGYTYAQFLDDLRPRRRKEKRHSKSPLVRFGRYRAMQKLLCQYQRNRAPEAALKALQLRRMMTTPYRVLVRFKDGQMEYSLSPLIPIEEVAQLTQRLNSCAGEQEATGMVEAFRKGHQMGG